MTDIDCSIMSDSDVDFTQGEDSGDDSDFDFDCENIAPVSSKQKTTTTSTKRSKTVPKKTTKKQANPASDENSIKVLGERSLNEDNNQNSEISTEKTKSKSGKSKTVEQIYQKKSQLEHILLRPDTYSKYIKCVELFVYVNVIKI